MEIPTNVLLIFLGSILTFLSTWAVESFKYGREKEEKERNFKLLAKQELQIILGILDTLKTTLEYKNYYDINTRNRLSSSRYTLEGYRRDAIHLSSQDLQEKFIDVVSRISDYHAKISSLQDLFWTEQGKFRDKDKKGSSKDGMAATQTSIFKNQTDLMRMFNENKLQYSIEHAELKRQIEELIKEFEK